MDIIDLTERRRAAEEAQLPATAVCPCGEAWFELRGGPTGNGAVCMTPEGTVTGYAGVPTCVGCGRSYQRSLRP